MDDSWMRHLRGHLSVVAILQFLELWAIIFGRALAMGLDRWMCNWTSSGSHSTKSMYELTFGRCTGCGWAYWIWTPWALLNFTFSWLVMHTRCSSWDRLAKRDLLHQATFPLYEQHAEIIEHLLLRCSYAREIWFQILFWIVFLLSR